MHNVITTLPRSSKKLVILSLDMAAIVVAVTLAIMLRLSDPWPVGMALQSVPFYALILIIGLGVSLVLRLPQIKLSTFDTIGAAKVGLFALMVSCLGTALNLVLPLGAPRTAPLIAGPLLFCLSVGWKLAASAYLERLLQRESPRTPVAVYGAGAAGIQLISALTKSLEFRVVAVVDDNPNLSGLIISGHKVQSPDDLADLARNGHIERILLAIPSATRLRRREIIRYLETLPCEVQALPGYADMIQDGVITDSLKPVSSDDLLGRDKVDLNIPQIAEVYQGKSVLISGAGGSIGSELCRQVLSCGPRRIVLFELSEYALYTIDQELQSLAEEAGIELIPVLGSVCDKPGVLRTLVTHEVDIVLHAAAYKHVPLVEMNELEGVRNNVFGTQALAEAAQKAGIERFILISTDKAVRPTNVMGATKRIAEMVIQDLQRRSTGTIFAMVRFGNVLGSSGSVIPLFQRQIAAGGPVTLTHPEVTRFFMTVPEAARLVLLAGSYARGADVFVLDMGEPVRIIELARRMIELSGLKVRDDTDGDGDISIEVTGLRPGEKLYEELLIDEEGMLATPHPKIMWASEACPQPAEVDELLVSLSSALASESTETIRIALDRWVEGYGKSGHSSDLRSIAAA
ncbi:MAG: nucleoside-diphosphate sugar epimerase/dehydratase [Pseudomonadota bacterium]